MFRKPRRRIRYTERAEAATDAKIDVYERLYEVLKSLEWLLERDPEIEFSEVLPHPHEDFRIITYDAGYLLGVPEVVAIYRYDDEEVEIWDLRIT